MATDGWSVIFFYDAICCWEITACSVIKFKTEILITFYNRRVVNKICLTKTDFWDFIFNFFNRWKLFARTLQRPNDFVAFAIFQHIEGFMPLCAALDVQHSKSTMMMEMTIKQFSKILLHSPSNISDLKFVQIFRCRFLRLTLLHKLFF